MDNLGAVVGIIFNPQKLFPIVYSDKRHERNQQVYWKFAGGHIEEQDFCTNDGEKYSAESLLYAAQRAMLREFTEETGITGFMELQHVCTKAKSDHLLYVFIGLSDLKGMRPPGVIGDTGELVSLATHTEILQMSGFLPAHRALFQEITGMLS